MNKGKRTCGAAGLKEKISLISSTRAYLFNHRKLPGLRRRSMGRIKAGRSIPWPYRATDFRRHTDVGRRPIVERMHARLHTYTFFRRQIGSRCIGMQFLFHTMAYRANRVRVYVCTAVTRTSYAHTLHWYTTGKHSSESYLRLPTPVTADSPRTRGHAYVYIRARLVKPPAIS